MNVTGTRAIISPAVWDDTVKQMAGKGPIQTGEQHVCEIICDGIQFRSWLPDSREHAERINAAARKLAGIDP